MPEDIENRKRGAPRGNQNARKHGFYSRVLSDDEQQDLEQAILADSCLNCPFPKCIFDEPRGRQHLLLGNV